MGKLIEVIISKNSKIKDQSLDSFCKTATTFQLLEECRELDIFRRENGNLYFKVRALFFLYAIHRFYLPDREGISYNSLIPYEAYEYNTYRESVVTPIGYFPQKVLYGNDLNVGSLNSPSDMFYGPDNLLYILDSGQGRIIVTDENMNLTRILDQFKKGSEELDITGAKGLFVDSQLNIYIAEFSEQMP